MLSTFIATTIIGAVIAAYIIGNLYLLSWIVRGLAVMVGESAIQHGWFGRVLGGLVAFGACHLISLQVFLWFA